MDAFGTGLTLPFLVVYLHAVRGIGLETVGLIVAVPAAVAHVLLAPIGVLVDHFGPRRIQMGALVAAASGALLLSRAETAPAAFVARMLTGIGAAAFWPANDALVAGVVPSEIRQRYFGVSFALLNAGIGVGGIVGALFVESRERRPSRPSIAPMRSRSSCRWCCWLSRADTSAARSRAGGGGPRGWELRGGGARRGVSPAPPPELRLVVRRVRSGGGWVDGIRERHRAGLRAHARHRLRRQHDRHRRLAGGRSAVDRRTPAHAHADAAGRPVGLLVAILGTAGRVPATPLAAVLVVVAFGVFAVGETLLSPILPAIRNDVAPEALRGRYNAAAGIAFQLAHISGPSVAGVLLGAGRGNLFIAMLVGGCALLALVTRGLEQVLPPRANGVGVAPPAHAASDDEGRTGRRAQQSRPR